MTHGTGDYWIICHKATIKKADYVCTFERLRNYYHEQMSDCYEPTWEDKDEYQVIVRKWRKDRWGDKIADHLSEGYRTGSIDKNTANKIYWNIKNRDISFKTCRKFFKEIAGREIEA